MSGRTEPEGQSRRRLSADGETLWRPHLHGEHTVLGQSLHYITDGHDKYVWYSGSGHEQLFDLDQDSLECHGPAQRPEQAQRVVHWRQRLIDELAAREEGFVNQGNLVPGQTVQSCLAFLRRQARLTD